jgi:hypothetical protein
MKKYLPKSKFIPRIKCTVFCFGVGLCSPFQQECEIWNRTALASIVKRKYNM